MRVLTNLIRSPPSTLPRRHQMTDGHVRTGHRAATGSASCEPPVRATNRHVGPPRHLSSSSCYDLTSLANCHRTTPAAHPARPTRPLCIAFRDFCTRNHLESNTSALSQECQDESAGLVPREGHRANLYPPEVTVAGSGLPASHCSHKIAHGTRDPTTLRLA
jgi:hypothetical protein